MGTPYAVMGCILLLIPVCIRDFGYKLFARHRGTIWKNVKKAMGMGDTMLVEYRDRVVGLEEPLDPGWGFDGNSEGEDKVEEKDEEGEGQELKPLVDLCITSSSAT